MNANAALSPARADEPVGGRGWSARRVLGDLTAVLRTAVNILGRHWPVLFAASFGGLAARAFLGYAAVRLSRVDNILGLLVFILVPITTLVALILMMWLIRGSLPASSQPASDGRGLGRARRLLDLIGSVLIPFLAVYASYGYLQADRADYLYSTWLADPTGPVAEPQRLTATLVIVMVLAVGLRFGLNRWKGAKSRPWLGIIGGYLEIVWIAIAAGLVGPVKDAVWAWLDDRRVVHGGVTAVHQVGQLGDPVHRALDWLGGLLGSTDTVIVVPVAWLAVGAIVYGQQLGAEPASRRNPLVRAAARRWVRLPKVGRRLITGIRAGAEERFGPLVGAFRVLSAAGLASMLMFCLLFLVTQTSGIWLFMLERWLIGPRNLAYFWMPVSDPLSVLNDGVRTVLLVCLLGAAVDRVLRTRTKRAEADTAQSDTARSDTAQSDAMRSDTEAAPAVFEAPTPDGAQAEWAPQAQWAPQMQWAPPVGERSGAVTADSAGTEPTVEISIIAR